MLLSSRSDTTGGGGGATPPGTGPDGGRSVESHYTIYKYDRMFPFSLSLNAFRGVPAWKTSEDNLVIGNIFGEIPFFTYDPSKNGKMDFQFPLIKDKKGFLSNFWAGCEPTSSVLNKLIDDGMFCSLPSFSYSTTIRIANPDASLDLAYMFRDDDIPKLIFVFSNEFDNELYPSYDIYNGYSISNKFLSIYPTRRVGSDTIPRSTDAYANAWKYASKSMSSPWDVYCFQQIRNISGENKIREFIENISLSGKVDDSLTSISNLYGKYGFSELAYDNIFQIPDSSVRWKS